MRPSIPIPEDTDDESKGKKERHKGRRFRGGTTNVDQLEEGEANNDDAVEFVDEEEDEKLFLFLTLFAMRATVSHTLLMRSALSC
jgi:hypothetical protein